MLSDLTLAEELVLLATTERGSTESAAWASLDNGIAGARLLELSLAGRLQLGEKGAIVVADERPTGDELTDEALSRIAESERRRDAKHWVSKLSSGTVRKRVLARLDDRGVLAAERSRFLGLVPRTRHVEVDPGPEREVCERLRGAVLGDAAADPRTVALAALVKACGLTKAVFGREDRRAADRRIKELAEPDAVGAAVKSVTDATTAAVIAATTAATAASAAGAASGSS
jgi:Golgi phosphoprotein 3 (GPP34)